jgi:hypothetical protein
LWISQQRKNNRNFLTSNFRKGGVIITPPFLLL